jgi:hypothetical protein
MPTKVHIQTVVGSEVHRVLFYYARGHPVHKNLRNYVRFILEQQALRLQQQQKGEE